MNSYCILKTKVIGELLLVANPAELIGVYFADSEHANRSKAGWKLNAKHPVLRQASAQITDYLNGKRKNFTVPMRYEGTAFQQEIWRQIARIPFGETISYTELAQRAGAATALRAAGTATGKNPISIIVPCHRVVGKNGGLGGYAGGLERKIRLHQIEANSSAFRLKIPATY